MIGLQLGMHRKILNEEEALRVTTGRKYLGYCGVMFMCRVDCIYLFLRGVCVRACVCVSEGHIQQPSQGIAFLLVKQSV